MRVLVVGFGSIGRRHAANIRALEPDAEIFVLRRPGPSNGLPAGVDRVLFSLAEAVAARPQAALICGPSTTRVEAALALAAAGAHLFVEKPLASDLRSARAVARGCAAAERVLAVGYNLRFSSSLRAFRAALLDGSIGRPMTLRADVGQYLPEWRPGSDYRTSASARSELGGGAALELSHEFDYIRWLLGDIHDVYAVTARLSDLEIDVEDTAEVVLRFQSGAIGSVHLDMAQRSTTRTCRIVGVSGTLLWNALLDTVEMYRPNDGWTVVREAAPLDANAAYLAELTNFFSATRGEDLPLVSGDDGIRALEIALAVRRSAATGRAIARDTFEDAL